MRRRVDMFQAFVSPKAVDGKVENLYTGSDLYSGRDRATVSLIEPKIVRRLFLNYVWVFVCIKSLEYVFSRSSRLLSRSI